ncbi:GSCOCG00013029001-RA-CDS, partial [Cotesia congregata]
IKKEVPNEQVCNTVDKIRKTRDGDMLIELSRKSTDKGQALQKTIQSILKVISKSPQEQLEIRDIDDTTTKDDIRAALQEVAGDSFEIPEGAIKIRPAYRGTQTALVTLPITTAQTVLGERGKIKIGWSNCRVRVVKRPQACFKCWHYGHVAAQCRSGIDRSKLCIKCGQTDHIAAKCPNEAKCMLCDEKPGSTDTAHRAGSSKCPLNINHCEAAHDLLLQTVRELGPDLVLIAEPY